MNTISESTKALISARRRLIGGNLSISYREPLQIVRGNMQYLFDDTGRQYLDGYNNVPHIGHCHPAVREAAAEQLSKINTNTRYLHENLQRYAEALTATLPPSLSVCYFVNSGSEANELALRLARTHTNAKDMIVLEAAYHGHTTTLIDISPYKVDGPGGAGHPPWVHVVPNADVYRGPYKANDPTAGIKYAEAVAERIETIQARGSRLCAYIAESCPSVGGQIIFPAGYLSAVYGHVRKAGGVCIADDVQTGYGRIGSHFYGFEQQEVTPDIVVLGKPIGNGYPLGAVITTSAIAASFNNGMEYFSTFGGSTVSCAVGLAVLETVKRTGLQAHARQVGAALLTHLRPLADRHALIGDIRGSGFFIGIELVKDRETLAPATEAATEVINRMRSAGVLIGTDGEFHNVLKVRPPMPFGMEDATVLVDCLDTVLSEMST